MHTMRVFGFDAGIFESDGAADDRFSEYAGEHERQDSANRAGQETPQYQTLLHAGCSVAGEAEQMAGVVEELVYVGIATEHRNSTLVDADEVQRDERQDGRRRQPKGRSCRRQINRSGASRLGIGHGDSFRGCSRSPWVLGDGQRV
jgi:hypothetical protein